MEEKEALAYLDGLRGYGSRPGLERVGALLENLGDPQKKLKFIHIAGTNGKGSCAAMTASVLRAAGCRTGLFTSPCLRRVNEQLRLDGRPIGDAPLAALTAELRPLADAMEEHPTQFEVLTALALLWFAREGADIAVLEAGLGGRLDATNVIDSPEAAVLMNIGLDHTAVLGGTVEQIAREKAGIIKPGCAVVLYPQSEPVERVIRERCAECGAPLRRADFSQLVPEFDSLEGQVFTYRGVPCAIPLLGAYQRRNAAVVLELVEALRARGWRIGEDAAEHGLYAVRWPARFELVHEDPAFVVDGGHNPQCAETAAENLLHYFPDKRRVLLVGVLADKDYRRLTERLAPAADAWVCVTPDSERALPAAELGRELARFGKPVTVCESIPAGVSAAMEQAGEDGAVCAVGSLYMAGAIRACFQLD